MNINCKYIDMILNDVIDSFTDEEIFTQPITSIVVYCLTRFNGKNIK
jgi:hypothetical protein